jgi:hypothetical protein
VTTAAIRGRCRRRDREAGKNDHTSRNSHDSRNGNNSNNSNNSNHNSNNGHSSRKGRSGLNGKNSQEGQKIESTRNGPCTATAGSCGGSRSPMGQGQPEEKSPSGCVRRHRGQAGGGPPLVSHRGGFVHEIGCVVGMKGIMSGRQGPAREPGG